MSGSKTAYLSQSMLDYGLGGVAYTPPANVWVVLSTSAFDPAATGASCSEVVANGYARAEYANTSATWSAATAGAPSTKTNVVDFTFAAATTPWGTPQSVYLADAATAGNLLYGADITNAQSIGAGDTAKIPASTFTFTED